MSRLRGGGKAGLKKAPAFARAFGHKKVDVIGIEPTTSSLRTRRSPKLSYTPVNRSFRLYNTIIIAYPKMKSKFSAFYCHDSLKMLE